MADMIEIKHLNKYFGDLHVLKDINLTVKRGEKLVMIGPSGSGKSTLIRCVDYLEEPTSGEVVIDGTPLTKKNHLEMARKYSSMVFQQFNLFPHMTILDNMTLAPMKLLGRPKDEAETEALKLLERVGLKEKASAYPGQLSGGQKQRLTIARALVGKPDILILDDSASALDYATDAALRKALAALPGDLTVFIVSQRAASLQHADQIIVLDDGRMVGLGRHADLLESCPVYKEIYESQFKKGDAQK